MVRTSKADKNYLSWSGDTVQWCLGTDFSEPCLQVPDIVIPENPLEWDSILKISNNRTSVELDGIMAAQGAENCLDCNNYANDVDINGFWGVDGDSGDQVITIKGGSHSIKLSGPVFSRGTDCDIELGCWSDQSFRPSFDLNLSGLYGGKGQKLTVKIARVKDFWKTWLGMKTSIRLPQDSKILRIKSLGEYVYWWAKFASVKLGLFKK